jgi:hypothetical protein
MTRDIPALLAFIESRTATPFAWGRRANDCVSFAACAVKAQTGHHRLDQGGRLRWSTPSGAARIARRYGGVVNMIDARFRRIAPAAAMRGDIAGVADPLFGVALMIVEGDMLAGPGPNGVRRLPRAAMVAAWSAVGER